MTLFASCDIQEKGSKTDVYILHGFRSSQALMHSFKQYFQKKPVNVISCSARGHGSRLKDGKEWEFDQTLQEYSELITQRSKALGTEAITIGHSIGGSQSIALGISNPHVKQAIGVSALYDLSIVTDPNNHQTFTQKLLFALRPLAKIATQPKTFPASYPSCQPEYASKLFLLHNTNDQVILPSETAKNKQHLCLPDSNVYYYNGTKMFGHRTFNAIPYMDNEYLDQILKIN